MNFPTDSSNNSTTREKKRILFLCTGNACRSQMAEGWARSLLGDRYDVCSAGTNPGALDPQAVKVMGEKGVDISGQKSKHVDEFAGIIFDLVVTICDNAREKCPFFSGSGKTIHHSFDDPPYLARVAASDEEALSEYRRVRDEIRNFVTRLDELL